jgi:hypothetical protein
MTPAENRQAAQPHIDEFAKYRIVKDAVRALRNFLMGKSRIRDVLTALGVLEERFGMHVISPCAAIRRGIHLKNEIAREQICFDAIDSIEAYVRAEHCAA